MIEFIKKIISYFKILFSKKNKKQSTQGKFTLENKSIARKITSFN